MHNKTLVEFLVLKEVQEGLLHNIQPFQNENSVIEQALHYSQEKQQYLVEVRIFNNEQMENAYLDIFNEDMSHVDEYVDDVWAYADWTKL